MTPQQIEDQIKAIRKTSAEYSTPGLARKFLRDAGILDNGIYTYQSNRSATLHSHDLKAMYLPYKCRIIFGPAVHMMQSIVAKWIITIK